MVLLIIHCGATNNGGRNGADLWILGVILCGTYSQLCYASLKLSFM